MRVAVAQINTVLGNFTSNKNKVLDYAKKAKEKHCDLVIFPESTLFGYHPFDLLERSALVDQQLKEIKNIEKNIPAGIAILVGVITKNTGKKGRPYFNSAALIQKGKKTTYYHKQLLPTGDVFDEARFIEQGKTEKNFFTLKGKKVLVTICEDIWAWPDAKGRSLYLENPLLKLKSKKPDLVVNLSASPFYPEKLAVRKKLVQTTATYFKAPMIYANLIGAQDEIIFDGGSFAVDKKGKDLMNCVQFEEELGLVDLNKMEGGRWPVLTDRSELLRRSLVLGIRDFCKKIGIEKLHFGLSGGVDSALVACLATDALGPQKVTAIALPGPFNSASSLSLAKKLAKNLGIKFLELPITEIYEESKIKIDKAFKISQFGLVHENLQARIRGLLLMAYSNKENSLLLNTSNKSEFAAGYSTLYGDMCGGLSPIGDLTKAQVYDLCEVYNHESETIPKEILTRAPSAELRPNQKDQDTLPPYDDLDKSAVKIVEDIEAVKTATDKWLIKALIRSEFKRWQAPPILKVSKHSFGRGRRLPVAHQAKEIE